eukprot:10417277-Lingulodinium_polyedra.AAC.1
MKRPPSPQDRRISRASSLTGWALPRSSASTLTKVAGARCAWRAPGSEKRPRHFGSAPAAC